MSCFFLPIFHSVIMDWHPIFWVVDAGVAGIHQDWNIGCPSIMIPLKMDKTKKSHLLFAFLVRIVLFLHFIGGIYLSKILLHHFIGFIWIITLLLKINVSIQKKQKLSRDVRHARKFRLRTNASRDTRCSRALNKQLPWVIADRAIHHCLVMDGRSFGQNQWNFLLTC